MAYFFSNALSRSSNVVIVTSHTAFRLESCLGFQISPKARRRSRIATSHSKIRHLRSEHFDPYQRLWLQEATGIGLMGALNESVEDLNGAPLQAYWYRADCR
jgi:hypothetical protein